VLYVIMLIGYLNDACNDQNCCVNIDWIKFKSRTGTRY
jgi:hypothetical protein